MMMVRPHDKIVFKKQFQTENFAIAIIELCRRQFNAHTAVLIDDVRQFSINDLDSF